MRYLFVMRGTYLVLYTKYTGFMHVGLCSYDVISLSRERIELMFVPQFGIGMIVHVCFHTARD